MELTNEMVSLDKMPTASEIHSINPNDFITIGDLHGNAVKLLYFLIREGVVQGMSETDYQRFNQIYKKQPHELTKDDIETINQIISRLQINPNALQAKLCFIGDMLCDRGQNDYFTLKLIEKLHKEKVPFKVLLSNHDLEFIQAYEAGRSFSSHTLLDGQGNSAENLQKLMDRGLVSKDDVTHIIEAAYLSHLNVLDFSGLVEKDFAVYSHAPIGMTQIFALAVSLKVDSHMLEEFKAILDKYNKENPLRDLSDLDKPMLLTEVEIKLLKTIILDMNNKFREKVEQKQVTDLCQASRMNDPYGIPQDLPFVYLTWNRNPTIRRPSDIHFVYGHDKDVSGPYNLDNHLGKGLAYHDRGEYKVLHAKAERPQQELHYNQENDYVTGLWNAHHQAYKANPRQISNQLLEAFINYLQPYARSSVDANNDRAILMIALWENNYYDYIQNASNRNVMSDDMLNVVINHLQAGVDQQGYYSYPYPYPQASNNLAYLYRIREERFREDRRIKLAEERKEINKIKLEKLNIDLNKIEGDISAFEELRRNYQTQNTLQGSEGVARVNVQLANLAQQKEEKQHQQYTIYSENPEYLLGLSEDGLKKELQALVQYQGQTTSLGRPTWAAASYNLLQNEWQRRAMLRGQYPQAQPAPVAAPVPGVQQGQYSQQAKPAVSPSPIGVPQARQSAPAANLTGQEIKLYIEVWEGRPIDRILSQENIAEVNRFERDYRALKDRLAGCDPSNSDVKKLKLLLDEAGKAIVEMQEKYNEKIKAQLAAEKRARSPQTAGSPPASPRPTSPSRVSPRQEEREPPVVPSRARGAPQQTEGQLYTPGATLHGVGVNAVNYLTIKIPPGRAQEANFHQNIKQEIDRCRRENPTITIELRVNEIKITGEPQKAKQIANALEAKINPKPVTERPAEPRRGPR